MRRKSHFLSPKMVYSSNKNQYYKLFNNRRKLADTLVLLVFT